MRTVASMKNAGKNVNRSLASLERGDQVIFNYVKASGEAKTYMVTVVDPQDSYFGAILTGVTENNYRRFRKVNVKAVVKIGEDSAMKFQA